MLKMESVTKRFINKVLFSEISYHFPENERISIVGSNGAGKTTLLNILCGIENADNGTVSKPNSCRLGYLPQEPNPNPKDKLIEECQSAAGVVYDLKQQLEVMTKQLEVDHSDDFLNKYEVVHTRFTNLGGYELESKAYAILDGLGFQEELLNQNPKSLSGGWRMRLELAKLFIYAPDILILDEPTNHLDLPSLAWVENYLQNYSGTLIFVSHDRSLLNRLSTVTVHLQQGEMNVYKGNYDFYIAQAELKKLQSEKTFANIDKRKKELQNFIDRFGAKASKAAQANSKAKLVDKLDEQQASIKIPKVMRSLGFNLPEPPSCDRIVLEVEDLTIGYHKPLCKNINFQMEKGQKIAIIGSNGIGKSTLLKTVHGVLESLGGSVKFSDRAQRAYFAQNQHEILDFNKTVMESVLEVAPIGEPKARGVLGSLLFSGEDAFKKVGVLSGGEKSRVGIACVLAQNANVILFDEPTNHLDMESIEHLIKVLATYKGTLLFVSHDREFINALCTHVLVVTKSGDTCLFEGDLEDYQTLAKKIGFVDVLSQESQESISKGSSKKQSNKGFEDQKQKQKVEEKRKKQLEDCETRMESLKQEIYKLEDECALVGEDFVKLKDLHRSIESLKKKLEVKEEEWISLSEQ